jgi:hypothetical protein
MISKKVQVLVTLCVHSLFKLGAAAKRKSGAGLILT